MRILLVDDHADSLTALAGFVEQLGHQVATAADGRAALALARAHRPDLVISDLRMPGLDGLQLLAGLEELEDPPPCALVTAYADAGTAVDAMRLGAVDYLRKPVDVREIHRLIERIECGVRAKSEVFTPLHRPGPDGLIIAGPVMAGIIDLADRLHAAAGLPCLIEAETGCGKELVARRVHHGGQETARPFVALNCAAIPPGLFEAELFGYVPGAFTGAAAGGSPGRMVLAGDGTLFLDEIGELPGDQQAKLLRVLEERTFYPVGGAKLQRLQARVVCASNRNLFNAAREGRFREDLLYRLKVGFLRIPPLRERRDEIVPLAGAMLASIHAARQRGYSDLTPEAAGILQAASWPGNVRQLRHVLERTSVFEGDGGHLGAEPLLRAMAGESGGSSSAVRSAVRPRMPLPPGAPPELELPPDAFDLDAWHAAIIAAALRRCEGSPVKTATYLGISRKVLYTLRKRYGLMEGRA